MEKTDEMYTVEPEHLSEINEVLAIAKGMSLGGSQQLALEHLSKLAAILPGTQIQRNPAEIITTLRAICNIE